MTSLPCLQSVSLSYLLAAYLIQGISSLFQAVLTFRQAGPFQRELLAHARLDNLVVSETCFPPSFPRLSVAPVSLSLSCLFISVCSCLFLSSPFLSWHASLSTCFCFTFEVYLHLYLLPGPPICFLFGAPVFSQLPSLCCSSSVSPCYQVVQQRR